MHHPAVLVKPPSVQRRVNVARPLAIERNVLTLGLRSHDLTSLVLGLLLPILLLLHILERLAEVVKMVDRCV